MEGLTNWMQEHIAPLATRLGQNKFIQAISGGMMHTMPLTLGVALIAILINLPMPGFLNLTPPGYSKASGIDILCEALGIGLEQVITFGDGGNDLEMIAHVPNGVAVQGAVSEVAAAARWHIGRCEDETVPAAIEALVAGEWPFER